MEALSPLDPASTGRFRKPDAEPRNRAPERARDAREGHADARAGLRYRRSDRTTLYVETREGDLVRLRIDTKEAFAARSTEARDSERLVTETTLRARSATRVSLHVHGKLDDDELAALKAVFEHASALADEFFSGELRGMLARASALDLDAERIATAALKLRS